MASIDDIDMRLRQVEAYLGRPTRNREAIHDDVVGDHQPLPNVVSEETTGSLLARVKPGENRPEYIGLRDQPWPPRPHKEVDFRSLTIEQACALASSPGFGWRLEPFKGFTADGVDLERPALSELMRLAHAWRPHAMKIWVWNG